MRKILLFLICLIVFSIVSEAQVGFLGKRLVVKTNALSGILKPFRGIEVEYVLRRNLTVSLGYNTNSTETNFNLKDIQPLNSSVGYFIDLNNGNYNSNYYDMSIMLFETNYGNVSGNNVLPGYKSSVQNSRIVNKLKSFDLNFRLYSNSYLSSPHGFYSQYGISIGKQTISGGIFYPNDFLIYSNAADRFYSEDYEKYNKTETFVNFQYGLGYQFVIARWVTLDFNINGGASFRGDVNNAGTTKYASSNLDFVSKEYPKSTRLGNLVWDELESSNQAGFFVSGFVKLGILIF